MNLIRSSDFLPSAEIQKPWKADQRASLACPVDSLVRPAIAFEVHGESPAPLYVQDGSREAQHTDQRPFPVGTWLITSGASTTICQACGSTHWLPANMDHTHVHTKAPASAC